MSTKLSDEEKLEGCQIWKFLAGPVGEHYGEVRQIHLSILIDVCDSVCTIPVEKKDGEVDKIYFFVFI